MTIKSADLEVLATRRSQYPEGANAEFLFVIVVVLLVKKLLMVISLEKEVYFITGI